ncbi:MAG: hypothetical protein JW719_04050 [Pirellulales bacterium]|nr:hypothetical protein [Pirellulales bacterium]
MNRRERLMATLRGESVDRVPVCFYEINGFDEDPDNSDPMNVFNDPSWRPVLDLAREKTDRIVMRSVPFRNESSDGMSTEEVWAALDVVPDFLPGRRSEETWQNEKGSKFTRITLQSAGRKLQCVTRRDPDTNTIWTVEPLLKNIEDLEVLLGFPRSEPGLVPDVSAVLDAERRLGETGIVMIDTYDPLCVPLLLFDMQEFVLSATLHPDLLHALLALCFEVIHARIEAVCLALPGRLWRIYGPEAATPPLLPPNRFSELVVQYDKPLIETIQRHGGYARIHAHGRIKAVLEQIAATGCDGLDPIEPPPQGDVELIDVRAKYGRQMVLFGNLEAADLENLSPEAFREKVAVALAQGTAGEGRGFVLMPSGAPYGRNISAQSIRNYETMIEMVEKG